MKLLNNNNNNNNKHIKGIEPAVLDLIYHSQNSFLNRKNVFLVFLPFLKARFNITF